MGKGRDYFFYLSGEERGRGDLRESPRWREGKKGFLLLSLSGRKKGSFLEREKVIPICLRKKRDSAIELVPKKREELPCRWKGKKKGGKKKKEKKKKRR